MKVKIKRLNEKAVIPAYAHATDAGLDLVATSKDMDGDMNIVYGTGLAFEIPKGYVGLVFPRSSNCKKDLLLSNSVGVIDSGYRGEVTLKFRLNKGEAVIEEDDKCKAYYIERVSNIYEVGDRVGQIIIIPYPHIEFEEAGELSDSDRGTGGYGSTGK